MNGLIMATAMALAPAQAVPVHEVVPGESLSVIAQCELGDAGRWVELLELNRDTIDNPDIIVAGWQLKLPEGATGECPIEPVVQAASAPAPAAPREAAAPRAATPQAASAPAPRATPKAQPRETSSGSGLNAIKACESGGDYGAVSSSGKYRGAYQFDRQTWQSVGGTGDPAAASPAEQDRRAAALQAQRGSSPWPNCG